MRKQVDQAGVGVDERLGGRGVGGVRGIAGSSGAGVGELHRKRGRLGHAGIGVSRGRNKVLGEAGAVGFHVSGWRLSVALNHVSTPMCGGRKVV